MDSVESNWQEFTNAVWAISFHLAHQWAMAGKLDSKMPSSNQELEEMLERIEARTYDETRPGPAGWGITAPALSWGGRGSVYWQHTTGNHRWELYGEFDTLTGRWSIEAHLTRPYRWHSRCARLAIGWYGRSLTFEPPVAQRHVAAAQDMAAAMGITDIPAVEILSDRQLAEADAAQLLAYYG